MEEFVGSVKHLGNDYTVTVLPHYNELLNEVNYAVTCQGFSAFLMIWENEENPCFKTLGPAPYEIKEAISIIIEHHDA